MEQPKVNLIDGATQNVVIIHPHTKWWNEEFAPLLNLLGKNDPEYPYTNVDMFRVLQRGEYAQDSSRIFDLEIIKEGCIPEDYVLMMKGELLFRDGGSPNFETVLAVLIDKGLIEWPEDKSVQFEIWW